MGSEMCIRDRIMDPPLDESINSALADVNNGSDDPTEQEVLLQLPRGIN